MLGGMAIELPRWLLVIAYSIFDWRMVCRFARPLVLNAVKALPHAAPCTLALMALRGSIAALLVFTLGSTRGRPTWQRVRAGTHIVATNATIALHLSAGLNASRTT